MKTKEIFKQFCPDIIVILCFAVISLLYFLPATLDQRMLFQHDMAAGAGSGQEVKEYYEQTGERSRWTNALFGGMPTYQIAPSYDSTQPLKWFEKVYRLFLPTYASYVFIMLLGFYLLLRAFGISAWLSALGGILWAFSSYFFILIAAGHIWKLITLAYIPPTLAGIVLTYRKHYLFGAVVTALFLALQIQSNHIQMSYYFLSVIICLALAYFFEYKKKNDLPHFFKASAILVVAALIGIAANSSNLYHTYQYSKESMRGKSELTANQPNENATKGGLSKDYITQWSYGIGETMTLLIPNARGGASVPLSQSKEAMSKANMAYTGLYSQLTQYFGTQPMTSGPVYVGAFVLFLFILGCFIVKGPFKWALLSATVLSILLSWGKNFMPLTDFFIDYIPMYNKFRAVSSILVVAELTIPLLAILALKEIITNPQLLKTNRNALLISFILTGGVALVASFAPDIITSGYIPANELQALKNGIPANQLTPILMNLEEMRSALVTADARTSFFIICAGLALLGLYSFKKLSNKITIAALALLCLADLWHVNKRYLHDEMFVSKSIQTSTFKQTNTDKQILNDKTTDFRVLNLASNTFNENNTSYWHKSIGGYHAAKLRRYQDMIEHYIAPQMQTLYAEAVQTQGDLSRTNGENFNVLNMLNARYFILPTDNKGNTVPVYNPHAFSNAWFVNHIHFAENANEEIKSLGLVNLQETAVIDQRFKNQITIPTTSSNTGSIRQTSYAPNKLTYETQNEQDGLAVFSEIYYPGWRLFIDGQEAEISRANYILRAANIPAGKHVLTMEFNPRSLQVTETIAYTALFLLLLSVVSLGVIQYKKMRKEA